MKYLIALVLLVGIAGCSDSDMEYECSREQPDPTQPYFKYDYFITVSADKMILTRKMNNTTTPYYYAFGCKDKPRGNCKDKLGGYRTYLSLSNQKIVFRTKDESIKNCERIK